MSQLNLNTKNRISTVYHILFWLAYFLFNLVRWGSYFNDYWYSLKSNLVEFPIHIIVVYINVYYLIPKMILRKRYWIYLLSITIMLAMVYILRTGLNYLLVTESIWPEAENEGTFLQINHVIAVVLGELYVIGFVSAIKLLIDWSVEKRRNEELAKLQLNTELKYLRTQIQPHFFFNTLNNLYALTLIKSDKAPHLVIKISEMMQYVLYEINSSKVSLLEEINYINNFIDISRLRYNEKVDCEIEITGDIEDVELPPLLFLTFIENCFKHGLVDIDVIKVRISFEVETSNYLTFRLSNSFNPESVTKNEKGIGIGNVQRRLSLLFGNNFVLESHTKNNMYYLFLKIPL